MNFPADFFPKKIFNHSFCLHKIIDAKLPAERN